MGVKVPRVTLSADFGDKSSFGELSLLSLGYGMHQAWVYATMFAASPIFGIVARAQGLYGVHVSAAFIVSIIVFGLCLLICAATDQKHLHLYVSKRVLVTGTALMCVGTLMLLIPATGSNLTTIALETTSGIATGIGSSILILFWGVAFARCDSSSIVLNTAIAVVVAIVLYAAVLCELPFPFGGILTGLIPLGELYILWKKTPTPYFDRGEIPIFKPLPVRRASFVARFGLPVFVFGIALGTLRQTSIQSILPGSSIADQALMVLAACCTTVLILVTIMALSGAKRWNNFFRSLVPFVAIAALLLPMAAINNMHVSSFLVLIAYMCFEALMWIFFGEISQRFRLSPIFVFGLGRGLLALAALLGSLLPIFASAWVDVLPFGETTIVLFFMVVMVIAYAILPDEKEIEAVVIPCPVVHAVSSHLDDKAPNPALTSVVKNTTRKSAESKANAESVAGITSAASVANAGSAANAEKQSEAEVEKENKISADTASKLKENTKGASGAQSQTNKQPQQIKASAKQAAEQITQKASIDSQEANASTSEAPQAANTSTNKQPAQIPAEQPAKQDLEHISAARAAMYNNTAHAFASTNSNASTTSASAPKNSADTNIENKRLPGRFRMKCETVANTFLLSRRETEVMFLLAKGHNSAYIQEKLYISEGTAKTHIRHIYRKLDVHTQQELMRLVESIEVCEY